ncbi:hypothetical protein HCN44_000871 [Aphidius gifuensis]|uniref:RRM domain-containing protein n=1 Tax=Aphidius gifuensis TaxID=684658 RepID=A0A835CSD5_APHGI|nr:hypothetical protein HCN44_000871 [Aphidius gifuensis]
MKIKQDCKQKPVLKVKKVTKNSESYLNKAVKNVKQILKAQVKNLEKGLVYIGHIPHGFYEEQMKEYFSQFGRVTRTGKSRGYGYVEFAMPDVAVIAAESMNNYLMAGRLVKTTYVAPEDQQKKYFKGPQWSETTYPKLTNRANYIDKYNAPISEEKHELQVKKTMESFSTLSEKLKVEGIDLDFKISQTTL